MIKSIAILEKIKPFTTAAINKLECTLKVVLPESYRTFLQEFGGGRPLLDTYSFIELPYEDEEYGGISWLYGACIDTNYDLQEEYIKYNSRIPREFIPIGDDGCGNQICLGIAGKQYNQVYFWDHERESDPGEDPTMDNMYLIANSFSDFINKLYKFKLEEGKGGNKIWRSIHDRYSLPTAHYINHYNPGVILDFFKQPLTTLEEFVIEESPESTDLTLYYDDKEKGLRHKRVIKPNSSYTDSEESIEMRNL